MKMPNRAIYLAFSFYIILECVESPYNYPFCYNKYINIAFSVFNAHIL